MTIYGKDTGYPIVHPQTDKVYAGKCSICDSDMYSEGISTGYAVWKDEQDYKSAGDYVRAKKKKK